MKKRLLALFLTLGLVCTVLTACGDGSKDQGGQGNNGGEAVSGGEITVGIAKDLDDSLDPHRMVTAGTREVLFNLFEGLVKPNSKGELIPAVAERYQLSEDGRTYTFTLREGVKFHNGATVTAEDVVRCVGEHEKELILPDQDVFNMLYGKQTLPVEDVLWNYDVRNYAKYLIRSSGSHDLNWVMDNTAVLHFCGKNKPWHADYKNPFGMLYLHYQNLTLRKLGQKSEAHSGLPVGMGRGIQGQTVIE